MFTIINLTTSSGEHLEDISHAHFLSLVYKRKPSAKDTDHLSIEFDRIRDSRRLELTNTKNIKGKSHVRIFLKDIFGFAAHQEKGTFGLGCKLILTRSSDNAVLNKDIATAIGKIKVNASE